jgi:hypothetical protein
LKWVAARSVKVGAQSDECHPVTVLAQWASEICPGHPIDLGIVRAVKILRDAGFETFEACEGGGEHAYPEPTVRFEGCEKDGWAAMDLLASHDLPIRRLKPELELSGDLPETGRGATDPGPVLGDHFPAPA